MKIMYHGTEKERGEKILADQKMPVSISTDRKQHWLGDGIYLYRELIYAFRWILLMYEERTNHHDVTEDLLKKYSVLSIDVEYNRDRIFNLDNLEHYMVFKETEKAYKQKSAFSSRLEKLEYTDGLIINIMFKNLKYGENYDAVEASFPICSLSASITGRSRIKSISEYQICVKNDRIIRKIEDVTDSINFKEYKKRFLRLEQFKRNNTNECGSKVKYIDRQRGEKYGKRKNIGRGIK